RGVGDKAKSYAREGLGKLGNVAKGVIRNFGNMAQGWVSKGAGKVGGWFQSKANLLADRLPKWMPSFLGDTIRRGGKFGAGLTQKFANGLNGKIREFMGKGDGLVDAGVEKAGGLVDGL